LANPLIPDYQFFALWETHTPEEIADMIGCKPESVRQRARRKGLPLQPRPRQQTSEEWRARLDVAHQLLKERSGYREAALSTGIDQHTLARHFPDMALTPREAGERSMMIQKLNWTRETL
jgi:hypothetical protein